MTEGDLLKVYGPSLFLVGWFLYREVWPLLKERLRPDLVNQRRKAEAQAEAKVLTAFIDNTVAMTGLKHTLEVVSDEMSRLREGQEVHTQLLAEMFGFFRQPRPSPNPSTRPRPSKKGETV